MLRRPHLHLLVLLALLATGCLAPGATDTVAGPPTVGGGAPTFAPDPTASASPAPAPSSGQGTPPADDVAGAGAGAGTASPAGATADADAPPDGEDPPAPDAPVPATDDPDDADEVTEPPTTGPRAGSVSDAAGDLAGDDPGGAPAWADLVAASIRLDAGRGEIVLRFAAPVPGTGREGEAVNVATFHDLTGDGRIDREIWASQTSDGWGTSYWDRQADTVRFAAEDDVDVTVDGATVRLSFPAAHLADAPTGRWQVTLEWVDEALLTQRLAVDDAPDDRGGARWGPTAG